MRAWVGVVAAAGLLLAGCSDSDADEPRVLPTVVASVAPSPSPSPVPTGVAAARDAAEFAKFVYDEIERAFIERDPAIIQAFSSAGCKSCGAFVASITSVRDRDGRVDGYAITVREAVAPASTGATARVDVIRDSSGGTFRDAAGNVTSKQAPLRGIEEQMDLVRQDGVWKVAEITRIRVRGA